MAVPVEVRVAVLEAEHKALAAQVRDGLDRVSNELAWFRNAFIGGVLLVVSGGILDKVLS